MTYADYCDWCGRKVRTKRYPIGGGAALFLCPACLRKQKKWEKEQKASRRP